MKTKYSIEVDNKDFGFTILMIPISAWLLMLTLGALGHRMNIPAFLHIGFFEALLFNLAYKFITGPGATKKVIKEKED